MSDEMIRGVALAMDTEFGAREDGIWCLGEVFCARMADGSIGLRMRYGDGRSLVLDMPLVDGREREEFEADEPGAGDDVPWLYVDRPADVPKRVHEMMEIMRAEARRRMAATEAEPLTVWTRYDRKRGGEA